MARAGRAGAGRRRAGARSRFRHQRRAGEAAGADRRPGAGGVRRDRRGGADRKARRRRHRVRARQRHRGAGAASAAAADHGRHAVGAGVDAGAGGAPRRRGAALRAGAEARRAHRRRSGPSSCRARSGRSLVSRAKPRVPGEWSEAERDPGPSERIDARSASPYGASRFLRWVPGLRSGFAVASPGTRDHRRGEPVFAALPTLCPLLSSRA